ncbi:response regulator transcription factor [Dyadobacter psychrophilus]|uniref:DNA-binding response regulator, OmpR family, contains REC and winged-helix (WHTH) domain n=1 Tax=Dyadobacter psychrophilus TaxID=651661 RepID=A0A1T5DEM4_9BACT|nr:response regulator transcription factor [Dyadobacter psychrophilus]SKB69973.1 DNA-binding response regulator, OmpR family, contains REC and winged-helix (wHTH) domain [Dyadobacter psychrophilus]
MKLLVIEDEKELSDSICVYLNSEQFACEAAYDYPTALEKVVINEYACIILDITLPRGSGLDILKELKTFNKSDGVLIISAKNSLDDRITGLNTGADDYLTKPFHLAELGARVAAIVRRKSFDGNTRVSVGPLTLDLSDRVLKSGEQPIALTKKEYELLLYFLSNKNRVVTKEAIVEHLWGDDIDMSDSYDFIYSHIKNLRKKLMNAGCNDYIKAVYGMGYKFSLD